MATAHDTKSTGGKPPAPPETPVFYDPQGRRWRRTRWTWIAAAVVATAFIGVFVASVLVNPLLPALNLRPITALPSAADAAAPRPTPLVTTRRGLALHKARQELQQELKKTAFVPSSRPSQHPVAPPPQRPVVPAAGEPAAPGAKPLSIGFYVNWDDSSYASLKRNLAQLDWVVPEWIRLQDGADPLVRDIHRPALDLLRRERPDLPIIPLVQNYQNEQWNPELLARAVATEESRQRLVKALLQLVDENKFGGVCIDLEEVPTESQGNLRRFMQSLHDAFHPRGFVVTQAVPFDDSDWNYPVYAGLNDYLILMGYDEHWESSTPGSIAGQQWFERTLARRMSELDPAKTIVAIGNYGYDWSDAEEEASEVTFQEAVLSARDSEAEIKFDKATRNPYFSYEEEDGSHHTVWFLDAVSAYDQMRVVGAYRPAGIALWRLGSEDPSLWSVFGSQANADSADGLRSIRYGYDVDFDGMGEILQVIAEPRDGAREFTLDEESKQIENERYTATPSSYVIRRAGYHPGLVALTFDDGPDPAWTPRILDILKREQVPATFFIIGQNGEENPELVRRIVAEGHDIGNHTFTHPNLGEIPGRLVDLELNATQRLIESQTGRSTTLFRPPYFGDAEPQTPDEVGPIVRARRLGYLAIGLRVDPDDWDQPRSTADVIVQKTVEGITSNDPDVTGQVVLLHDGGGEREQTIEALPRIINELRARGYRFVTTTELAGLTREQSMPPLPERKGLFAGADAVTFFTLSTLGWLLQWVFVVGITLGLARIAVIGSLAFAQWWRARRRAETHFGEDYAPFVSVIVPAYNEERVIAQTVRSLLASHYEAFEVIVVDDGSPDRTSEVVREQFGAEPRVRLFTKENAGKAEALNYGLRHARGEVVIGLDADTVFEPEALGALAHRFRDPHIGAVAGNAKVGNRINLVTRWQALEYITSQNMDRRAFASLNCITVVPGAVGAWRRELLEQVGGFSSDTLAEDQDLTLRVRRLGYKIGYSERALAWTEAPDTLRALAKQRFRWAYGTLQCMWKHKGALLRPRYGTLGFFAMPNVWVFQIIFPLVSPVMDLMLAWSLARAVLQRWQHGEEYAGSNLKQILFYYALFLAVDWLSAAFAFALEKREQWKLLWWLFLQRFCYRQVMYYVMIKSVVVAARGAAVGWGKLERKATVGARS
ncbi:MAG: glycosyltransferase [Acidobacteria bacterium]|nr:glycosyltransferase [Acidobacteriota bacterium]